MQVTLIMATDLEGGVGKNGAMPWKIPEEMRFFRTQTEQQIVIMGGKTFDSINNGVGLPLRINIVVSSRHPSPYCEGNVMYVNSPQAAIEAARALCEEDETRKVFVIGGPALALSMLETHITDAIISVVPEVLDCDTFMKFPAIGWVQGDSDMIEYRNSCGVLDHIKVTQYKKD